MSIWHKNRQHPRTASPKEEEMRTVLLEDLPLALVNVAQPDVDQPVRLQDRFDPRKLRNLFLARARQAHQERDGATVQVAGGSRERRVDVL
jgi:hypothetical protein